MFLKVIYRDLTLGKEKAQIIKRLMKAGRIIAIHSSEGWVEVRRMCNGIPYKGRDRRENQAERFFAKFYEPS